MSPEVTVIGCDGRPFSPEANKALAKAQLVIGAPRHLDADPNSPIPPGADRKEIKHLDEALDALDADQRPVAVLASGDPGFFGIVRALRARGLSQASSRPPPRSRSPSPGWAWTGTTPWWSPPTDGTHEHALAAALAHPKAAILTAPRTATARDLGQELLAAGKKVYVAECLGTPQERITDLTAEPTRTSPSPTSSSPSTQRPRRPEAPPRWLAGHQGAPDGWALPEDVFKHRDSMITKAEVRALILARLGPAPGNVIWDVGAGSGSVAVECARFGA